MFPFHLPWVKFFLNNLFFRVFNIILLTITVKVSPIFFLFCICNVKKAYIKSNLGEKRHTFFLPLGQFLFRLAAK